jgi:hypothetical protein
MPAMTKDAPIDRRLGLAIATASAAVTLAIGVTAGTFLGWVRPPEPATSHPAVTEAPPPPAVPAAAPPVIQAPVESTPVQVRRRPAPRSRRTMLADARDRPARVRHDDDHHERGHHEEDGDDD